MVKAQSYLMLHEYLIISPDEVDEVMTMFFSFYDVYLLYSIIMFNNIIHVIQWCEVLLNNVRFTRTYNSLNLSRLFLIFT